MKEFLEFVAEDILAKYGTDLSRITVVFPNKRASLFLNEHLARKAGKPIWSPTYITISELFSQAAAVTAGDPIKLVCDLHKSFCAKTGSDEPLDKFFAWGQLMLSDFDDVDKNMADADKVFANVTDLHELDDVSYLTPEQREVIKRFFSNFTDDHDSLLKERFIKLWSHFADIYHDFNERLAAQQLAYEGALYRQVAEDVAKNEDNVAEYFKADRYLFVGFNLLQKVEQQLFKALMKAGKAKFYWDFDDYYLKKHEAGHYISQYLIQFPNELDGDNEEIYNNFSKEKSICFMSAATENIQARYISTWLDKDRIKAGRRTAIVLCNEGLLQTIIHCVPDTVASVNITMGYPLSQTPVASLIRLLFNLLTSQYPPRQLRLLKRHPLARFISTETLGKDFMRTGDEQLTLSALRNIETILEEIAHNAKKEFSDPLSEESIFRAYTIINRLKGLTADGDLTVDIVTLQKLTDQLIGSMSIPFHGEPAKGLQIMGVLETRNLDFDHLLILSCNEGNMPKGVNDSSFIPHSLRNAYELTTVDNKVAIYAYYFHRMLQHASDITIVYNNSTEDGKTGEQSRFMLQMLVESGHSIRKFSLQSGYATQQQKVTEIAKTEPVMKVLTDTFTEKSLTPTAINKYMRCQLQFYYRYIANLQEPDADDDEQELDSRAFGNIFHHAAEIIYNQLPRHLTRQVLEAVMKDKSIIERAVDTAFREELPTTPFGGLHLINREVIIRYLQQLLAIDIKLTPFTIVGLECKVERPITIRTADGKLTTNIGGWIDRLDQIGDGTLRIVDYKTGSHKPLALASVEDIFEPAQLHNHSDYYLQTFVYADIVRRGFARQNYPVCDGSHPASPALLFIQHANGESYDPTLCFGRTPIRDIAEYSGLFNEMLQKVVEEMFNKNASFMPTADIKICQSCPYRMLCGR